MSLHETITIMSRFLILSTLISPQLRAVEVLGSQKEAVGEVGIPLSLLWIPCPYYGFPDGRGSSIPDLLSSLPRVEYASRDSGLIPALS
jgi:hypothetical protein